MRVFITGASGFIGGHTARRLVEQGHEVWAMARSSVSAEKVSSLGATAVSCALGSVKAEHLSACDAIVHCAAFVEEWGTRERFFSMNVAGTEQLLQVAREAGVSRFIHISTEAVLFDGHDLLNVDETAPYPKRQRFLYSESKAEAERLVIAADGASMRSLCLRPRFVWGPGDTSVLPTIIRMAEEGSWVWLDGGRHTTSTTHVRNLVAAIELALEAGEGGQIYFVADEGERSMRQFMHALASTAGVDLGTRSLPGGLVRVLAAGLEAVWTLFGVKKTPPMTRFAVNMMSASLTVNTDKARRDLGYQPIISVDDGLAELRGG